MQNPQVQYSMPSQPGIVSAQPQTVIVQADYASSVSQNFKSQQATVLGSIQICAGIFSCISNIVLLLISQTKGSEISGYGIWCGVIFILAGSFGIAAAKRKSRCLIVTFMVLSIISAVFAIVVVDTTSAIALVMLDQPFYFDHEVNNLRRGFFATLLVVSILEGVSAIWSSAICCKSVCCCRNQQEGQVLQMIPQVVQYGKPDLQSDVVYATGPQQCDSYGTKQSGQQPGQGSA